MIFVIVAVAAFFFFLMFPHITQLLRGEPEFESGSQTKPLRFGDWSPKVYSILLEPLTASLAEV